MTLGEIAYERYKHEMYMEYNDDTCEWYELDHTEQQVWQTVAEAVRDEVGKQLVRGLIV